MIPHSIYYVKLRLLGVGCYSRPYFRRFSYIHDPVTTCKAIQRIAKVAFIGIGYRLLRRSML
jgi:hypothetical protein